MTGTGSFFEGQLAQGSLAGSLGIISVSVASAKSIFSADPVWILNFQGDHLPGVN